MDRSIFESQELSAERLEQAAAALADSTWARYCVDTGLRELRSGRGRGRTACLTLVAASRLGRAAEVLPLYERVLLAFDSMRRPDWHKHLSEVSVGGDLMQQSGRLRQPKQEFEAEFRRIVPALGPAADGTVADIGCGGGLWTINLARMGYRMIGTERFEFLVEAARRNAVEAGVGDLAEFRVDEICNSALEAGLCSRALCIGVTPTLPDDAAFDALVRNLERITSPGSAGQTRRVVVGSNRWGPSRMTAVNGILRAAEEDKRSAAHRLLDAIRRLSLLQICWWLQPRHLDAVRARFPSVALIGETRDKLDGTRVDLLLR